MSNSEDRGAPSAWRIAVLLCALAGLTGCDDDTGNVDAGTDAAPVDTADAGAPDAGAPDAGSPAPQTCDEVDRTLDADPLPPVGSGDVTLSGTYRIDGRFIYDAGQTVTIEAGTVFLMGPDARLFFGFRNDPATVFANGTEEAPILFCGTQARRGHWQDLQLLGGTTSDSYLEHVRIEDAGGNETSDALAAFQMSNALRLSHVTVTRCRNVGMDLSGLSADSEELVVNQNDALSMRLRGPSAISNLPEGVYRGNTNDVIEVSGFNSTQVVFHDRLVPYRQTERRVIFNTPDSSMTLEAGVEYRFCQDCSLVIGFGNGPGTLSINGVPGRPVFLTSGRDDPEPGDWNGLVLDSGSTSATVIDYADFQYGGKAGGGNLIIEGGQGTVRNSIFADSLGAGIFIDWRSGSRVTIEDNNAFRRNAEGDIAP